VVDEEFKETKGAIRIRISRKNRKHRQLLIQLKSHHGHGRTRYACVYCGIRILKKALRLELLIS